MRLNLGCGDDRRDGWVNIDLRAEVADVVAPVEQLPFPDNSVDEILAFDIAEHFREGEAPFREWWRVLRPGGRMTVRVPNLERLGRMLAEGHLVDQVIENIYGGHRWGPGGAWDAHHWGWTPLTFTRDMEFAGFRVVSIDAAPNMVCEVVKE